MQTACPKIAVGALTAGSMLLASGSAWAWNGNQGTCWWGWPSGMGFGSGWMGGAMMILFWGLIIVGGVLLVRWLMSGDQRGAAGSKGGRALDILEERYARGEISKEQFQAMKQDILS